MSVLHTLNDGSVLCTMSARALVQIPVWKGNRTLDKEHVSKIRDAIGSDRINILDNGYRIIQYMELDAYGNRVPQKYLIDGQHRASVIREHFLSNLCCQDFSVVVTEKTVESETDAIEFFNAINNVKIQKWTADPKLIVNSYILGLEKAFPSFIRLGKTKRPYLSVIDLREVLENYATRGQLPQESYKVTEFVTAAVAKNADLLRKNDLLQLANTKDSAYYKKAAEKGFMLAVDLKMRWIKEILEV